MYILFLILYYEQEVVVWFGELERRT